MTGTTATTDRKVPTRRVSFEDSLQEMPKHFAAEGDLIASHLIAVLSAIFPDGEDFFVRSVRHFRGEISDPELKREVGGFIGQEAIHGREHRVLNDRLDELGYPTKRIERLIKRSLGFRERIMSPKSNLAATAALEHFTATFAELILSDDHARSYIGEHAEGILMWHALEESEHKAVAFDVYRAVGGTERMRTMTMNALTAGFLGVVVVETIRSLIGDPASRDLGRLRRSWSRVRRSPFLDAKMWHHLRAYNRPGFHPDDFDSSELIAKWRTELFGTEGSLTDKLATTTAAA